MSILFEMAEESPTVTGSGLVVNRLASAILSLLFCPVSLDNRAYLSLVFSLFEMTARSLLLSLEVVSS